MNPVPLIFITEMLVTAFGIHTARVALRHAVDEGSLCQFEITDDVNDGWQLDVSTSPLAPDPQTAQATGSPVRQAQRWGYYWRVTPATAPSDMAASALPEPPVSQPVWSCADGRALERVGTWLAQPAGLPAPTDILGQCFMDTWQRHRELLLVMHAQAEALHDGRARQPADTDSAQGHPHWGLSDRREAHRHQRVLRHLVETQEYLLGEQALHFTSAQRRAALRRLDALLDAERTRQHCRHAMSRAG